jgi:hypothetical protein
LVPRSSESKTSFRYEMIAHVDIWRLSSGRR